MCPNHTQLLVGGSLQDGPALLFGQVLVHVEDLMPLWVAHEYARQGDGVAQEQELIAAVGDLNDHVARRVAGRRDGLKAGCEHVTVAKSLDAVAIGGDAAASEAEKWAQPIVSLSHCGIVVPEGQLGI